MGRDADIRRKKQMQTIVISVFVVILLIVAAIVIFQFAGHNPKTTPGDASPIAAGNNVSPTAVAAEETPGSSAAEETPGNSPAEVTPGSSAGVVTQTVDAVGTLSEDAISEPAPKPRSKAVALTFDDGPSTANTMTILSLLEKYNAHATFFVVGNRVAAGADILKKELSIGCEIGNHSWDHANYSLMKMKAINKNLEKTHKLVKKITGTDIKLVRPPYGAISDVMRKKFKYPMILWSVDTLDWKTKNAKAVLKEVKKQVCDGAIILVHDIHESTAQAMKLVLPWLVEHDYDILTVSELMERNGIKMKAGKAYGSAN